MALGFGVSVWFGIAGPAKMPRDVIERVSREIAAIDKLPEVKAKTAPLGYDLKFLDSQHLAAKIAATSGRLRRPWPDLMATALPPFALPALCVAITGSATAPAVLDELAESRFQVGQPEQRRPQPPVAP